jgi:hypothetical protein
MHKQLASCVPILPIGGSRIRRPHMDVRPGKMQSGRNADPGILPGREV